MTAFGNVSVLPGRAGIGGIVNPKILPLRQATTSNAAKIVGNVSKVADVVSRVANIANLVLTLASIVRTEQIAHNSKARDAQLQQLVDALTSELNVLRGEFEMLEPILNGMKLNTDKIPDLFNSLDLLSVIDSNTQGLSSVSSQIKQDTGSILQSSSTILQDTGVIKQDIGVIKDDLSSVIPDIGRLLELVPQVAPEVIGQVAEETCKALNSDCWDFDPYNPEDDLSDIRKSLGEILDDTQATVNRIGQFPYDCQTQMPADGNFTNIAEAMQLLTCGRVNSSEELKELLEEVDRTDEVLEAIEDIDANASVPEHWQVRVGSDRPQLAVLYGETLPGNKIGRSRYQVSIPHWNGSKAWHLLPKIRKGNFMGRAILKDNSRIIVYCYSIAEAKRVVKALLKFVKPEFAKGAKLFQGEVNVEIEDIRTEPCTADWYEEGQETEIPEKFQIRDGK